jgi:phosphoribosyl 1,2-cyclic phosphodiesterase
VSEGNSRLGNFFVRFWGVRGSIACPGHDTLRYGGNTSCVEICCDDHLFIFDGGTGLREMGKGLSDKGAVDADIFFSHAHLDHIIGIPFFRSIFEPENTFRLWAGHLLPDHTLEHVMRAMMTSPLFPVPPDVFSKKVSYHDFKARETLTPRPGVTLRTAPLNHPNGATGYRLEFDGHTVCYVTDTEHEDGKLDENILELIEGADYMIYDCTYTEEEYLQFKGWGHSTWEQGGRLCEAAGVKSLVIFHHDPAHDDLFMDTLAKEATERYPNCIVAREGMVLRLGE